MRVPTAVVVAVLALPAVLAPAREARAEKAFGPAESLTYECKYLGIGVGKIQAMVGSGTPMNGQTVWPIMAIAKTDPLFVLFPIKDKFITWWNPELQTTLGTELVADEKNKRRKERIRFNRDENKALTTREKDGGREESTYDVPPGVQDILAALFLVRERRLAVGDHEEFPIFTGRKTFAMKLEVEGKERIEVPAGAFDTLRLRVQVGFSGKLESKRDVRVFVTDDARHVPVRLDAEFLLGTLAADLIAYQPGINR